MIQLMKIPIIIIKLLNIGMINFYKLIKESFENILVGNEQVKVIVHNHQFVSNMQQINHLIFSIEQIINLNEIFQMEIHI